MANAKSEVWHHAFAPSQFFKNVDLDRLIKRNEVFASSRSLDLVGACIRCTRESGKGIRLNDGRLLCEPCLATVSRVTFPERYEKLHRQYLVEDEAFGIARQEMVRASEESASLGKIGGGIILSLGLAIAAWQVLIVTAFLAFLYWASANEHRDRISAWDRAYNRPVRPTLRHFHDPQAELSPSDMLVLTIFNHWPGYPPYWSYLRQIVLNRYKSRCQVTGCPSRLEKHVHHIVPVSKGGAHSPSNLVPLCDFHHALEPDDGHERIWHDIKNRYFTMIRSHTRRNRGGAGYHQVRPHLRRHELMSVEDFQEVSAFHDFACPGCAESTLTASLSTSARLSLECDSCDFAEEYQRALAEETGPALAEVLGVNQNVGIWPHRADMLEDRKREGTGGWSKERSKSARKKYAEALDNDAARPSCPKCGSTMKLVRPKPTDTWAEFWGCTSFRVTGCRGSVNRTLTLTAAKRRKPL
jgi:predicted RNA-binding Zn-ribbon protein involved in translation (DUF1610 family)